MAEVQLHLPVDPSSVVAARHSVEALAREAGITDDTLAAVRLAVTEACTNVVLHAYAGRDPGPFEVRAQVMDRTLRVTVFDEGNGICPRPDSPGMGLGLPLIAQATQELIIDRAGPVTYVAMAFDMDQAPAAFAGTA